MMVAVQTLLLRIVLFQLIQAVKNEDSYHIFDHGYKGTLCPDDYFTSKLFIKSWKHKAVHDCCDDVPEDEFHDPHNEEIINEYPHEEFFQERFSPKVHHLHEPSLGLEPFPGDHGDSNDGYYPEPLIESSHHPHLTSSAANTYIKCVKEEVRNSSFLKYHFDVEDPEEFYLDHSSTGPKPPCSATASQYNSRNLVHTTRTQEEVLYKICRRCWLIAEFQQHADKMLKVMPQVSALFDFEGRIFPDEWATGIFTLSTSLLSDLGMCDPAPEVAIAIKPIGQNCEKLTPDLLKEANIVAMAKYLLNHNVLKCTNVKRLATSYIISTGEVASLYLTKNHVRSKLPNLPLGFFAFLIKEKLFNPQNRTHSNEIARFYAGEYSILSKKQKGRGQPMTTYYPPPMLFQHPYLNPSDKVCQLCSGPITQFIRAFESAVAHCPILSELFHVPEFNPLDVARDAFYSSMYFLQTLNADNVAFLGDFMSNFIREAKVLPPDAFIKHRSHFMAKYLWSEKFLHDSNAHLLGQKYAEIMKNLAGSVMSLKYPKSKLVVFALGIRDFLRQTQTFESRCALPLAFYYGNEWRCQLLFPFNN